MFKQQFRKTMKTKRCVMHEHPELMRIQMGIDPETKIQ